MKTFIFYFLVSLLVGSILSFAIGFWKLGMILGVILGGVGLRVGFIFSTKNHDYINTWDDNHTDRYKKYRE